MATIVVARSAVGFRPTSAPDDTLSATILEVIPDEGTTVGKLVADMGVDASLAEAAVGRLVDLKLIERTGDSIRVTPFARKARMVFNFTA